MAPLRIGSLFTGTGALDLAVMDVFDAEVVWHSQYEPPDKNGKEDKNQYAAKILERHWPGVPNLGDVTKIDWRAVADEYGPVDVLTGGFPCQDVSSAGKRAGLTADSRSGLWTHFARAIHELRPRLVVIENVEGLLSADADRGVESDAEALDEEARAGRVLRAAGAVLGDLATLGLHAEWERVGADEVGAPHRRRRVIIYAWPADADPADLGHERGGDARGRGYGSADGCLSAADAERVGLQRQWKDSGTDEGREAAATVAHGSTGGCEAASDADGRGCKGHQERHGGKEDEQPERQRGLDSVRRDFCRGTVEPSELGADDDFERRAKILVLRPGQPDVDWGDYGPAVRRWERVLGRRAPWPTDALGRLSAVFSEWMMGLPDGWVTCTPGLTRSAMLKALGNGVVRLQAAAALVLLHRRAVADAATGSQLAA